MMFKLARSSSTKSLVIVLAILFRTRALLSQNSQRYATQMERHSFFVPQMMPDLVCRTTADRSSYLHAKKRKKRPVRQPKSSSGFGGAAAEGCPCGSGLGYMKCCGKLHKDPDAYAAATAEQVVRARYSAYAKREIDFIIGSTHPLNSNFMSDIQHWRETIDKNCYDNFELTQCKILNESYVGEGDAEIATVQFVANMIQVDSREKTAFMETSTFERGGKHIRNGAWLYRDGVIEDPPDREEENREESSQNEESSA